MQNKDVQNEEKKEEQIVRNEEQNEEKNVQNEEQKQEKGKKKRYRLSAKNIFLTYSQVHPELEIPDVIQALESKEQLPEFKYIVAKEKHKDGGNHFHVILSTENKFDVRGQDTLAFTFKEKLERGQYTRVRRLSKAVAYVCKDNVYETNMPNVKDGRLLSLKELLVRQVLLKGRTQALLEYTEQFPQLAFGSLSLSAANRHFKELSELKAHVHADMLDTKFQLKDFQITEDLSAWMEQPTRRTLLLVGDSGCGKTSFAKAFCKEKNLHTLIVNEVQDLRRMEPSHEAIILDDIDLAAVGEMRLLSLLSTEDHKTIRVLYGTALKKKGLVQIVLTNQEELVKIREILTQARFARRVTFVQAPRPFVVNLNIQVHNYYGANADEDRKNLDKNLDTFASRKGRCVDFLAPDETGAAEPSSSDASGDRSEDSGKDD